MMFEQKRNFYQQQDFCSAPALKHLISSCFAQVMPLFTISLFFPTEDEGNFLVRWNITFIDIMKKPMPTITTAIKSNFQNMKQS